MIFLDPATYPELALVGEAWTDIRDEALASRSAAHAITDARAEPGTWSVVPLLPEPEDRHVFSDDECAAFRALAPRTVALLEPHARVVAYAFSLLAPGATIKRHRHQQPHITATLCLTGGEGAAIHVLDDQRDFVDGAWTVFDYTLPHWVVHRGAVERIVLLVLLERPDGFVPISRPAAVPAP